MQSGVFSSPNCQKLNHAVAIVGYGKSEGIKYWKIRNRLELDLIWLFSALEFKTLRNHISSTKNWKSNLQFHLSLFFQPIKIL